MSNDPFDLMKETILCLQQTYTVVDNDTRNQAEKRLKELESDFLTHAKIVLSAIKDDSILGKEAKISVILHLKRIIKKKIEDNMLKGDFAMEILKYYIDDIISPNLSDVCLQNLSTTLKDLLDSNLVTERNSILSEIVTFVQQLLVVGNLNVLSYRGCLMIFENIIQSSSTTNEIAYEVLVRLMINCEVMLANVFQGLESYGSNLTSEENLKNFLLHVDVSKSIYGFLCTAVIKSKNRFKNLEKLIEWYNKFTSPAVKLLCMALPGLIPSSLIAWQGDSSFDNSVNAMKSKVLQYINALNSTLSSSLTDDLVTSIHARIIQTIITNLDLIIANKFAYIKEMSKESTSAPDYNYENLIYQMLVYLSKILCKEPFKENFRPFSEKFAKDIIMPLLASYGQEIKQLIEDGGSYSVYINDIINEQKTKTIKTATAKILVTMANKFSKFSSFIISYCIQLIEFSLQGSDPTNLPQFTQLSSEDKILKLVDVEYRLETALLSLSILANNIFQSNVEANLLKNMFECNFKVLLGSMPVIIRHRMCLFIGLFIDTLYDPTEDNFQILIEYLFMNLFQFKENQGVAHEAADSLNDIFSIKKFAPEIKKLIGQFMPGLIASIKEVKFGLFFDVLLEIVLNIDVEPYLLTMLKELCVRVNVEIAPHSRIKFKVIRDKNKNDMDTEGVKEKEHGKTNYNLIINKCFNIIRTVTEKPEFVVKYSNEIEDIIDPLLFYMKHPSRIDFDEDLVLVMTSMIKHLRKIPKTGLKILPELPKYLQKSNGLLLDLYELVNMYILYGSGIIDENDTYNKIILKFFRKSFSKKANYDKSPFLGASLMQIWLQNSTAIPEAIVKEIITLSIQQINSILEDYKSMEDLQSSVDAYIFVSLIVVIYSGLINYPIITFESIIKNNEAYNLIKWTELLVNLDIFSTYQIKLLILGICSVFRNNTLLEEIQGHIPHFLSFTLELLIKQRNEESKILRELVKKDLTCNFIDSDDEEYENEEEDENSNQIDKKMRTLEKQISKDVEKFYKESDDDDYNQYTDEREVKDICDRTMNPLKTLDEYKFFKESVDILKTLKCGLYEEWTQGLSDKSRENLLNILHTARISICSNSSATADIPRKVVKIKKNTSTESNINK